MSPSEPSSEPTREPTWRAIVRLLRWDKPTGRLILLVPALWGLWLGAKGMPPWPLLAVVVVGTVVTSGAGCIVNDLWDRDIDPQVQRTRTRPLAAKTLSVPLAIGLAIAAFLCAYGLTFYLNPLSYGLCIAAVPVIVGYPLAKRVFPVPQLVLGIAWGFAVLIPWAAVAGGLDGAALLVATAVVLWTVGFDTVYALPDRPYDEQLGIHSSARFFGRWTPLAVTGCFVGTAVLLALAGWVMGLAWPYWLDLAIALGVWLRQGYCLNRSQPPPRLYGQIFRHNVALGFWLWAGMIAGLALA